MVCPKETTGYSKRLNGDVKAVLGITGSELRISWYADHKSMLEKILEPRVLSIRSAVLGIGIKFPIVCSFKTQKSMEKGLEQPNESLAEELFDDHLLLCGFMYQ